VWAEYFRLIQVSAYHENRKERSTFSVITNIEHDGHASKLVHLVWGVRRRTLNCSGSNHSVSHLKLSLPWSRIEKQFRSPRPRAENDMVSSQLTIIFCLYPNTIGAIIDRKLRDTRSIGNDTFTPASMTLCNTRSASPHPD
jgi:hypothetical protein